MELFKNIRLKIGENLLNKKLEKISRRSFYSNISMVKRIGIVWDASQYNEFIYLSKFYQKMLERKIDVRILGYFPEKILPNQYTAIRYLTCIRRDELNYLYHPVSQESASFISSTFDILIDINFRNLLPLKCLSYLSNAAFKVGLYEPEENNPQFDLMMEIKKPVEIDNYLDQTIQYLEMINAGKVEHNTVY